MLEQVAGILLIHSASSAVIIVWQQSYWKACQPNCSPFLFSSALAYWSLKSATSHLQTQTSVNTFSSLASGMETVCNPRAWSKNLHGRLSFNNWSLSPAVPQMEQSQMQ